MKKQATRPAGFTQVPQPRAIRDAWLGIDSAGGRFLFGGGLPDVPENGLVPVHLVANITTPSFQGPFRSKRFFVHREIASSFLIHHVFIGAESNGTVNGQPLIADAFSTDLSLLATLDKAIFDGKVIKLEVNKAAVELLGSPWVLPTIERALSFTMQVENIGDKPARFLAAFYGEALF